MSKHLVSHITKSVVKKQKTTTVQKPVERIPSFNVIWSGKPSLSLEDYFAKTGDIDHNDGHPLSRYYFRFLKDPLCISDIFMTSFCILDQGFTAEDVDASSLGSDLFRFLGGRSYYEGVQAFILSFDSSSRNSFKAAQKVYEVYRRHMGEKDYPEDQPLGFIVVGIQNERDEKREISNREASIFAGAIDAPYLELKKDTFDQLFQLVVEVASKTKVKMDKVFQDVRKARRKRSNQTNQCLIM